MSNDSDPLAWTREYTPVLRSLASEFGEARPLETRRRKTIRIRDQAAEWNSTRGLFGCSRVTRV